MSCNLYKVLLGHIYLTDSVVTYVVLFMFFVLNTALGWMLLEGTFFHKIKRWPWYVDTSKREIPLGQRKDIDLTYIATYLITNKT